MHDDYFKETPDKKAPDDIEWLAVVGEREWIAISHDQNIGRNPMEINAVMRARIRLFIVVGAGTPFPDLARNFVANIHKIEQFLKKNSPLSSQEYIGLPPSKYEKVVVKRGK